MQQKTRLGYPRHGAIAITQRHSYVPGPSELKESDTVVAALTVSQLVVLGVKTRGTCQKEINDLAGSHARSKAIAKSKSIRLSPEGRKDFITAASIVSEKGHADRRALRDTLDYTFKEPASNPVAGPVLQEEPTSSQDHSRPISFTAGLSNRN
ncbi:unnamed protein product [Nezara viridula]|uniref:Uncharacterized protein n=1 Tax=Nezara viridula TaxID=85310 RepID=A0A9P0H6S7_NEZVI|nr:unnamed protein product [Nezara viridula]